ncbi:MAG: hypothetical protein GSR73_02405 [Desulfurococcales archaeon]|nr:hypothetical protein [Desulfurococcales archaeon]
MPSEAVMSKLVEGAARIASGLIDANEFAYPLAPKIAVIAARNVGLRLRPTTAIYYCILCNRGPFTRKGYYLHLIRVHSQSIRRMIEYEIERLGESSRGQVE